MAIAYAPAPVIRAALAAARAIGAGLYGTDLKETGVEELVAKDELWSRLLQWFVKPINA